MFLASWSDLGRILIVGILAYAALVLLLRISGKRTLTKLNAFDLVITVALGSTLATIFLDKSLSLAEGVLALATLIGLQFVITWASLRSKVFKKLIKAKPTLIGYRGDFIKEAMIRERISEEEVMAVIRSQGMVGLEQAEAVVLETDGSISVLKSTEPERGRSTLAHVARPG